METASRPSKISRVDLRYRHLAQDVSVGKESAKAREAVVAEKEEAAVARTDEPLLKREQKGRPVMGKAHRLFHRRANPAPSNVLTVVVDVVATVDSNNNIIALETVTPGLPAVPAMPTVPIPSVPAVPPFPPDLTVPAYPFPSGGPTAITLSASQLTLSSPLPETDSSERPVATAPSSQGFNSTTTRTSSTTISTISLSTASSSSRSSSLSSSTQSSTSSALSSTSTQASSASSATEAATSVVGGIGGPAPTGAGETDPNAATENDSSSGGTPTPTVVGSVVGSLAGVALLLAIILLLLKRHKRNQRGGALQLSGNDPSDNQPIASSGQQMASRSVVPAGFLNRFSSTSKSTVDTTTTGERGFQRISGRKLPSAFSEGMTSEQFARGEGTLSGSSFYTDDQGFYGGTGAAAAAANKEFGKETGSPSGAMGTSERIMPSPARTPVLHHPGDAPTWGANRNGGSTLSPPQSPNPTGPPPRGTLGRSHPSHDGSRGSRFTEDV